MSLDLLLISFIVIEFLLYLFHLSVFFLLIVKKKSSFASPFFTILRFVIAVDLITHVVMFSIQKLTLIPVIYDLFKSSGYLFPSILFNVLTSMTCIQFLGHVLLAFNRFTLIWFPIKQKQIWNRQWYTVSLIIGGILYCAWRITEPAMFGFPPGKNVIISLIDEKVNNVHYILSTTVFMTTTLISAFLNIFTFLKFYLQKQTSNNLISINEKNLLYVSFFVFLAQIFRTSYMFSRVMFSENIALIQFLESIISLLYDIFAWSTSLSLIILSSSTRKMYKEFYFLKSNNSVAQIATSNTNNTNK